jgi:hypothetical protein
MLFTITIVCTVYVLIGCIHMAFVLLLITCCSRLLRLVPTSHDISIDWGKPLVFMSSSCSSIIQAPTTLLPYSSVYFNCLIQVSSLSVWYIKLLHHQAAVVVWESLIVPQVSSSDSNTRSVSVLDISWIALSVHNTCACSWCDWQMRLLQHSTSLVESDSIY